MQNYGSKVTATVDEVVVEKGSPRSGTSKMSDADTWYVYVNYEYQGQEYTHILSPHYVKGTQVGDKLTLFVDSDDPTDLTDVENSMMTTIVLIVMGVVVGIIGIQSLRGRI